MGRAGYFMRKLKQHDIKLGREYDVVMLQAVV